MKAKVRFAMSALVWAMILLAAYAASAQTSATTNQRAAKREAVLARHPLRWYQLLEAGVWGSLQNG